MALRTQIYASGVTVDLLEDISIPMTYSVSDVREPQKRSTNYSKTLVIPGTASNNILFAHLFDVHTSIATSGTTTFNPNLKTPVSVLIDNAEVFTGYLQLNRINVTNHYGIEYECTMFGNLANIFQTLGDKRLSQLDLSAYNHTCNLSTQVASWDTSIQKNGSTYSNFSGGLPIGEGYVYPLIDYGTTNGSTFKVTDFKPAVYVKTIVDSIFNQAGFRYTSSFFNSQIFKSLIVPYSGMNLSLTNQQAKDRGFRAQNNSTVQFAHPNLYNGKSTNGIVAFQDETTPPNWDTGGNYNNSTYTYTAPKYGTYKVSAQVQMDLTHYPAGASVNYGTIFANNSFGYLQIVKNGTVILTQLLRYFGGSLANSYASQAGDFVYASATLTSGTTTSGLTVPIDQQIVLNTGDTIKIGVFFNPSVTPTNDIYGGTTGHTIINVKQNSYFTTSLVDITIREGDPVNMNLLLPDNIKQVDFLTSIIKAFNLYIDTDKNSSNTLIIEPRDDFYSSGTTKDWSTKLDLSQPVTITPMGELDSRTYVFTYKDDGDYYNDFYVKKYREVYGYKKYSISNDFIQNEDVVELIFSPTPLADYIGIDRVIPKIFTVDNNNVISPRTSNIRLLYYGGIKTTTNPWSYVASSGTVNYSTYAYAGHLDSVTSPTIDLNFTAPREVFYTTNTYTTNNLFNKYWKKHIDEITDKDSKLVMGYFNLNSTDISNLSFFDVFYFENDYFRLNKIYDYDPTQHELTKCEFLKLNQYPAFVSTNTTIYGGYTLDANGDLAPNYGNRASSNDNVSNNNDTMGTGNFISSNSIGCSITGSTGSYISPGCSNVSLINTSGVVVYGGVSNVTVINTSGTTVSTSNQVIINSFVQPDPLVDNFYTPTLTNVSNITATTAYPCQFFRIGNVCTVSGRIDVDVAGVGDYIVALSLPIASAFTQDYQASGTGMGTSTGLKDPMYIKANVAGANVYLVGNDNDLTNHSHYFHFTYRIL